MPEQLIRGIAGVAALLAIALLCSRDRRLIQWKAVLAGIGFNMLFAVLILRTPGRRAFAEGIHAGLFCPDRLCQFHLHRHPDRWYRRTGAIPQE